ncbi:MarR family transcriptional regulator [Schleiferilactobacillus harbinensis]|uniref:MarR family winged helix-turn-helix transcriptional regulator n=1 Tax=Schleiferilactobacillus harbinensis TaxID=304207 RepID=UPI0021A37C7B|nr:MarR family winged helix-turn-helix transcriptional regulator [Schleiferilactobacillus harbinensis]MCT2908053.1 MarR family transcriptional regulator [Schleiferilactobacillus harbinensis]
MIDLKQDELEKKIVKPFERIARLYNTLEQTTSTYGTDVPLYPAEIHALTAIGDHPHSSLTELTKYLGVTKGTTTKIVQKLVKKGMVVKEFAPNSENQVVTSLTNQGKTAYQHHADYDRYLNEQLIAIYQQVPTDLLPYLSTIASQSEAFFEKMIAERQ